MMWKYHVTFSEKNLTGNAGLAHLGRFAEKIGLSKIIEKTLTTRRATNADYQVADAIMMLMIGVLAGIKHTAHMIILKNDNVFRVLFRWDKFPDAPTFGRIFRLFSPRHFDELADVENMARQNHLGAGFNGTWCLWLTRGGRKRI